MNQHTMGTIIKELREKKKMTQAELAERLFVSDKTISKWESAKGYPDISMLEAVAGALEVSVAELMAGRTVSNVNRSANMLKAKFYICPVCGNIVCSAGELVIHCCGLQLSAAPLRETDEEHMIFIEGVEDEYYVRIDHDMTKRHYISFAAALSADGVQLVKFYLEGRLEARFKMNGVTRIVFGCVRDGLFSVDVNRHIDGRPGAYDDSDERRALEERARKLFG